MSPERAENRIHRDEYASALEQAAAISLAYLSRIDERPVGARATAAELAARLESLPLPEDGIPGSEALAQWFALAEPGITASSGPRFFGFVNGGSTPAAIAGDWLASAIDQNAGLWLASPAATHTERGVMRWLAELFHLPESWAGTLTSGATMANLVGLAAGRQWVGERLGFDAARDGLSGNPRITVISTGEIHASAKKVLATLGLGRGSVITLPSPDAAMRPADLRELLSSLNVPVLVVANAGEVNAGTFDPLDDIADACASHGPGAWLHVDAAFGLFAALVPSHRHLVAGIERADSVASDGHKWLNVPYDCGFAFVRDADALRHAFALDAAYLTVGSDAPPDPLTMVPEMSRRFRALSVWCALRAAGRSGYQATVDQCISNTASFARWVEDHPRLTLLAPAPLNIVCFRVAGGGLSDEVGDVLTREVVRAIQGDGRAFVTGTTWRGRAGVRAAFDNWMTSPDDVRILCAAVGDAVESVLSGADR